MGQARKRSPRRAASGGAQTWPQRGGLALGRDAGDLDSIGRRRELGFDRRARWRMAGRDPRVPHCVHFGECAYVVEIYGGGENLGFVGSRFAEQTLDRGEDLLGLIADALALRLIGDLAGEIDG